MFISIQDALSRMYLREHVLFSSETSEFRFQILKYEATRARPGAYVRMVPHPNRGQPEIAQLVRSSGEPLMYVFMCGFVHQFRSIVDI